MQPKLLVGALSRPWYLNFVLSRPRCRCRWAKGSKNVSACSVPRWTQREDDASHGGKSTTTAQTRRTPLHAYIAPQMSPQHFSLLEVVARHSPRQRLWRIVVILVCHTLLENGSCPPVLSVSLPHPEHITTHRVTFTHVLLFSSTPSQRSSGAIQRSLCLS